MTDTAVGARDAAQSAVSAAGSRVAALRAAGRSIVDLSIGAPDFDTPEHIKQAAVDAIWAGDTRYTPVDGTAKLKRAVVAKFERENGLRFSPEEISVGTGGKQVIFNALYATVEPGDEVVFAAPYYAAYMDVCRVVGGVPVPVPTTEADGFKLTPETLAAAVTERTRWLIINSPGNPAGGVYVESELGALAEVAERHPRLLVMSDEIYEHMSYEGEAVSFAAAAPALADRTLTVNGVSKTYAMTGWRIGYGGGPRDLVARMAAIQSHVTTSPSSVGQAAAVAALEGPQEIVEERRRVLERRRDLTVARVNAIPGVTCAVPAGAMYLFPNCDGVIGDGGRDAAASVDALAAHLLETAGVAVVPGAAYGVPNHIRITFALSETELVEGIKRMHDALSELVR